MRHDRDLACRISATAPTASMAALSAEPDEGITVMVIPLLLRGRGSLREANFRFLLDFYSKRISAVVVVEQVRSGASKSVSELIQNCPRSVHYLELEIDSEMVHKCSLVNAGARYGFETLDARYVWQIDADILIHPVLVLRNLSILNSVAVPVVKPFLHFARLTAEASFEILALSGDLADAYEPPRPSDPSVQFETLVGPGSMIFSRHAFSLSGGMNESYSGWGWEDIEFAERLASDLPVHTLPLRAVHLHHEEDRQRNKDNANLYFEAHRKNLPPAEKARILAHTSFWNLLRKTCLIHLVGDAKARSFENAFAAHPETTHFFDLFSRDDLQRAQMADSADGIVERLAETLGSAETPCASFAMKFPFGEFGATILEILVASGFRLVLLSWPDALSVFLEDHPELVARIENGTFSSSERESIEKEVDSSRMLRRRFLKMLSSIAANYRLGLEEIAIEPELVLFDDGDTQTAFEDIRRFLCFESPFPPLVAPADPHRIQILKALAQFHQVANR